MSGEELIQGSYPAYVKYSFLTMPGRAEFLIANLAVLGFVSFEEEEGWVHAYIPKPQVADGLEDQIILFTGQLFVSFEKTSIPHENWNAAWEASFHPIQIGSFCAIRATFHDPVIGVSHELVIDPKMAFGTGHHETTWMMISQMEKMEFAGRRVLDYGAGTGILAILSDQLDALKIDALEIDLHAIDTMKLNLRLNRVGRVRAIHGSLHEVEKNEYDIILANINRNVILESLPALSHMVGTEGTVLFSGILRSDKNLVSVGIREAGFRIGDLQQRGEWLCIQACK